MDEKGPGNVWDSEKDEYQAVLLSYDLLHPPPQTTLACVLYGELKDWEREKSKVINKKNLPSKL